MSTQFQGLDELLKGLDELADIDKFEGALKKACMLVERDAKINAPVGNGELGRSIKFRVERNNEDIQGVVFTTLEYAPYVEYGTGIFAEGGKGRKDVPWYIPIGNEFTEAQAKKYNYEIIKGKNGMKWAKTSGSKPHPFMRPALDENREQILKILKEGLSND